MTVKQEINVRTVNGANFSAGYTGPFNSLDDYKLDVPRLGRTVTGKLFLRDLVGMTGMQISINKLPAGRAVPFIHKHAQNEETYIFIKGRGQMQVDAKVFDVEEGTVVRIGVDGGRCLRNNSSDDLHYICVQAKQDSLSQETFEDGIPVEQAPVWPD